VAKVAPKVTETEKLESTHVLAEQVLVVASLKGRPSRACVVKRRCVLSNMIGKHPLPINSSLGKRLALESNTALLTSTELSARVARYDKLCCEHGRESDYSDWAFVTQKKHTIKENKYYHTYSFNRSQRIRRNTEIVLGMVGFQDSIARFASFVISCIS